MLVGTLAELGCHPLIAVLEDRGVHKEAFLDLQNAAKSAVATATDSMEKTVELLRKHDLGNVFGLRGILQHLADAGAGDSMIGTTTSDIPTPSA